jgi:cobalt/nickel transport system permease protein
MVNFPVAAGTSGHLIGATLVASLLGLPSAVLVMTSVLFVQCFVFGDGGVVALGANVFNMALVSSTVGFCTYKLLAGYSPSNSRRIASVASAAFIATVAASASCAAELAWSGTAKLSVVAPAMLGVHSLIGIGEAAITATVMSTILKFRPELLAERSLGAAPRFKAALGYAFGLSLGIAMVLSPFASAFPDGLSRVAEKLGFESRAYAATRAPLLDYAFPGVHAEGLATALAGVSGAALMFGVCWLLATWLLPSLPESSG